MEQLQHGDGPSDDVFTIERNYRAKEKVVRSRLIRQMRREEAHPHGRKNNKRIRKYRPMYAFNSYPPDQPWDILAINRQQSMEESIEESIEIQRLPLTHCESTVSSVSLKEAESMSKQTICEVRPFVASLYMQAFTPVEWAQLQ